MARTEVTQEMLKELFAYDPETGIFTRKKASSNGMHPVGSIVSAPTGQGYLHVCINKSKFMLHRLAWLYVFGRHPNGMIDHINLNKADNRIANLRECNCSQNCANGPLRSTSTSGVKGVSQCRVTGNWRAKIYIDYQHISLGTYKRIEDAKAAYAAAAAKYFGEFARVE